MQICTCTNYTNYIVDPSTNDDNRTNSGNISEGLLSNSLQLTLLAADPEDNNIIAKYSVSAATNEYPDSRNVPQGPLFYGWFYDKTVSDSLKLISQKYLAVCYDYVPEFSSFLDRNMYFANVSNPFAYYVKPSDPDTRVIDPFYHTTAKFCGRLPCPEYAAKVAKVLGKSFQMHIVGLFFTKRTYGYRIKLTSHEQDIFEVDERKNSLQTATVSEVLDNQIQNSSSPIDGTVHEYEGYFHSGKTPNHPLYPGIHFEPQPTDFHPTESRAHVTIGCAPKVQPQQTGLDLVEIVDLEISGHIPHLDFSIGGADVPKAILRQFWDSEGGDPVFVLYPKEQMVTDATFSVYI